MKKWPLTIMDVLIALVFAATIVLSLWLAGVFGFSGQRNGSMRALITVDGTEYVYPLDEDRTIEVTGALGPAVLVIEDGTIRFESSTCRDLTCVRMGRVGPDDAHFAACLPNRIVVTLEGTDSALSNTERQGSADELDW